MFRDKHITVTALLSLLVHGLLLRAPWVAVSPENAEYRRYSAKELLVNIDVENGVLPQAETVGEENYTEPPASSFTQPPVQEQPGMAETAYDAVIPEAEPLSAEIAGGFNTETVIERDMFKETMLRYEQTVKQQIQAVRRYPAWAKQYHIEGEVSLSFMIDSDGRVNDIQLIHSSGNSVIDQDAVDTVKRAGPFLPIPGDLHQEQITMTITLVYKIE